jgi:hypothetical protein
MNGGSPGDPTPAAAVLQLPTVSIHQHQGLQFSSICISASFCSSIDEFLCISKLVNEEFLLVASWRHCRWMILCPSIFIFMPHAQELGLYALDFDFMLHLNMMCNEI